MNHLKLVVKYEGRIRLCFDIIERLIPDSEIYIYGKYAQYGLACTWWDDEVSSAYSIIKGYAIDQILKHSKLAILVLVEDNRSYQEIQDLTCKIEDLIYDISGNSFLRDIRVLNKNFYNDCVEKSYDMQRLNRYKKNLREIKWIDK